MKYFLILVTVGVLTVGYVVYQQQINTPAPGPAVSFTSQVTTFFCSDDTTFSVKYTDERDKVRVSLSGSQYILDRTDGSSDIRYIDERNGVEFSEQQGEVQLRLPSENEVRICTEKAVSDPIIERQLIRVTTPSPKTIHSSPIELRGEARGYWFFEATAPVDVVDWDGRIIGQSYITAQEDWMTEGYVPFSGTVSYTLPANSYSASGTVIFRRSNPSGLPQNDSAFEVPITLILANASST